jgi:hypothetical protein
MKRVWLIGLVGVVGTACQAPNFETGNRSDVILRFDKIQGAAGTAGGGIGTTGDVLFSDVLTCTDITHVTCSTINDSAVLNLEVLPKNPAATLGKFDDVSLTSYTVAYFRSDGLGVEGVDVPFAISGTMATLISQGTAGTADITVVRHQAKEEPPLKNINSSDGLGNGKELLTLEARITVYGTTTSGKSVSATGSLEITFADFGP